MWGVTEKSGGVSGCRITSRAGRLIRLPGDLPRTRDIIVHESWLVRSPVLKAVNECLTQNDMVRWHSCHQEEAEEADDGMIDRYGGCADKGSLLVTRK